VPRDPIAIGNVTLDGTLPEPVPGTRLCHREDQSFESKFVRSHHQRTSDRLTENVSVARLDLAEQESIAAFVQPWDEPLHLLINKQRTPEGWELRFGTPTSSATSRSPTDCTTRSPPPGRAGGAHIVAVSWSGHHFAGESLPWASWVPLGITQRP
jgi:hypothetical protein